MNNIYSDSNYEDRMYEKAQRNTAAHWQDGFVVGFAVAMLIMYLIYTV